MILFLIELEILHLGEHNLFIVETYSKVLAHVEIPGIFKEIVFQSCHSLFLSLEILDLSLRTYDRIRASYVLRALASIFALKIINVFVSPFLRTAFVNCSFRTGTAQTWLGIRSRQTFFQNLNALSCIGQLIHEVFSYGFFQTVKQVIGGNFLI